MGSANTYEIWPTDRPMPYENNPRHNDEAVEYVAASIREFGFRSPIVVDEQGVIIAGHTRLKAAKILGLDEVPVLVAHGLDEDQVKALRLADNKTGEFAEWDLERLQRELTEIAADLSDFGFDESLLDIDDLVDEDDYDEDDIQEDPRCQPGDIWALGEHRLMCGDSTSKADVTKLMGGEVADLAITDPPYNVELGYNTSPEEMKRLKRRTDGLVIKNDSMGDNEFEQLLDQAFRNMSNNLKPGGAYYVWHASRTQAKFEEMLIKNDMPPRQQLIWVKSTLVMGRQDYQWKHEPCFYGWKSGASHYFFDSRTETTTVEERENLRSMSKDALIEYINELIDERDEFTTILRADKPSTNKEHPTMKPLKLMGYLIRNSSKRGELVLDLFGGSGSTMLAAEQIGRRCYMMELDPAFCDVVIERWEAMSGLEAKRAD